MEPAVQIGSMRPFIEEWLKSQFGQDGGGMGVQAPPTSMNGILPRGTLPSLMEILKRLHAEASAVPHYRGADQ